MKIKELYTDESKWIQGKFAGDKYDYAVSVFSDFAVCFCLSGAAVKCYQYNPDDTGWEHIVNILEQRLGGRISKWNDAPERTFAEVKALVEELDI